MTWPTPSTQLAIESGSEWMTADRGFGRFNGLRWRSPLAG